MIFLFIDGGYVIILIMKGNVKKRRIVGILIRGTFFTLSRDKEKMDADVRFIDVA